jgi:hypothetical protein
VTELIAKEEQVEWWENEVLVVSADEGDRDLPHTFLGSAHYLQPSLESQYEEFLHDALLPHILPV